MDFNTFTIVADIAADWSDHALWWPARNCWLSRTRSTLDQYGVQADALLHFTPMHKTLRVQLPDLRYLDCRVDFSVKTFNAVVTLCKELGIRHPEELSFGPWPTIRPIPTLSSDIMAIRPTAPTTVWTTLRPPPDAHPSCPTRPSIGPPLPSPRPSARQLM